MALFPLWWTVVTSLKEPIDIFAGVSLVPQHLTFATYSRLFGPYHMGQFLRNSAIIVSAAVAITLVVGSLAAYALARFRSRLGLNRHALVGTLVVRMLPAILLVVMRLDDLRDALELAQTGASIKALVAPNARPGDPLDP